MTRDSLLHNSEAETPLRDFQMHNTRDLEGQTWTKCWSSRRQKPGGDAGVLKRFSSLNRRCAEVATHGLPYRSQ
jgi:hypothetical protein